MKVDLTIVEAQPRGLLALRRFDGLVDEEQLPPRELLPSEQCDRLVDDLSRQLEQATDDGERAILLHRVSMASIDAGIERAWEAMAEAMANERHWQVKISGVGP